MMNASQGSKVNRHQCFSLRFDPTGGSNSRPSALGTNALPTWSQTNQEILALISEHLTVHLILFIYYYIYKGYTFDASFHHCIITSDIYICIE